MACPILCKPHGAFSPSRGVENKGIYNGAVPSNERERGVEDLKMPGLSGFGKICSTIYFVRNKLFLDSSKQ
jgi:hypothetical protein